jgi:hypothetical protein
MERFTTNYFKDGKYIREEVIRTSYDIILLAGNATITHVGGYGRFKFILDGISYTSTFVPNICSTLEELYFDYSLVKFNIDIKSEWSNLYINESKEYWKPIK